MLPEAKSDRDPLPTNINNGLPTADRTNSTNNQTATETLARRQSKASSLRSCPEYSGPSYGDTYAEIRSGRLLGTYESPPGGKVKTSFIDGQHMTSYSLAPTGFRISEALLDDPDQHRRRRREIVLMFLVGVLLCICCILSIVLLNYHLSVRFYSTGNTSSSKGISVRLAKASYCLSHTCMKAASEIKEMMNSTADVCNDFYGYACGGWIAENSIPPTSAAWSRLAAVRLLSAESLKNYLESENLNAVQSNGSYEWKLKTLYEGCLVRGSNLRSSCEANDLRYDPMLRLRELPSLSNWNDSMF